ncbi:MAG: hypothetical protein AB7C98_01145 [Acidithiobacillus sp.]
MASIQKRGNYWRVQIRRKGYPALSSTFDTKAEATLWAAQQEKMLSEQTPERVVKRIRDHEYRLVDALDRYVQEILPGKKPTTQRRDQGIIKALKAEYGEVALARIDGPMLAGMGRHGPAWAGNGKAVSVPIPFACTCRFFHTFSTSPARNGACWTW